MSAHQEADVAVHVGVPRTNEWFEVREGLGFLVALVVLVRLISVRPA